MLIRIFSIVILQLMRYIDMIMLYAPIINISAVVISQLILFLSENILII